jgi:hypothetical protein
VLQCVEPVLTATEVASKRRAYRDIPEAALAAYVGLPAVLVWETQRIDPATRPNAEGMRTRSTRTTEGARKGLDARTTGPTPSVRPDF